MGARLGKGRRAELESGLEHGLVPSLGLELVLIKLKALAMCCY